MEITPCDLTCDPRKYSTLASSTKDHSLRIDLNCGLTMATSSALVPVNESSTNQGKLILIDFLTFFLRSFLFLH